jgi:pseudaminic acid biosynthesis-associated methylase
MTTEQEQFWSGEFGSQYVGRNRVDWALRVPYWEDILLWTGARSVLEVGCNIGSNLKACRSVDRQIELTGVDVNQDALMEATLAGLNVHEMSGSSVGHRWPDGFDLVATVGVLIHVAPEHLSDMMDSIIMASRKYVLAVEYAAEAEEHIEYRGHTGKLWRRPFGELYQAKGLKLIETGDAGNGFDRCVYWLLTKADA